MKTNVANSLRQMPNTPFSIQFLLKFQESKAMTHAHLTCNGLQLCRSHGVATKQAAMNRANSGVGLQDGAPQWRISRAISLNAPATNARQMAAGPQDAPAASIVTILTLLTKVLLLRFASIVTGYNVFCIFLIIGISFKFCASVATHGHGPLVFFFQGNTGHQLVNRSLLLKTF